jgi:hypothetical protein
MSMTVTPGEQEPGRPSEADPDDDVKDPLASWGRTGRLVVIRIAEAAAPVLPVLAWWAARR